MNIVSQRLNARTKRYRKNRAYAQGAVTNSFCVIPLAEHTPGAAFTDVPDIRNAGTLKASQPISRHNGTPGEH